VTTDAPSGDWAMCSTRAVWPVSSAACRQTNTQQQQQQQQWAQSSSGHCKCQVTA
jgi:hypothetical protein